MTLVIVSPAADRDTDAILEFIRSNGGPSAAAVFNERLDAFYKQVSQFPDCGAPRDSLGQNVRIGVVRPYVVIYRRAASSHRLDILRVLHGHRDIAAEMEQE